MKKSTVIGLVAGLAAGAATTAIVGQIAKEIKNDMRDQVFVSPNGDNRVTLSYGTSKFARGLTYIKVISTSELKDDPCKMVMLAKKGERFLSGQWVSNEHFELLIGNGKRKQCCDVTFSEEEISAHYYVMKIEAF